jgi:hypothetical protein
MFTLEAAMAAMAAAPNAALPSLTLDHKKEKEGGAPKEEPKKEEAPNKVDTPPKEEMVVDKVVEKSVDKKPTGAAGKAAPAARPGAKPVVGLSLSIT